MSCIYILKNKINNHVYVGKTIKLFEHRLRQHLLCCKNNSKQPIHRAIRKYGIENFIIKTIPCVPEMLDWMEKTVIQDLKDFGNNKLYNLTNGGEGMSGWKPSEETLIKFRKNNSGSNNPNFGKKTLEYVKEKISFANSGVKHGAAKSIVLTHPDGTEELFGCISDTCKKYNLCRRVINYILSGKYKKHKGYSVRYLDKNENVKTRS